MNVLRPLGTLFGAAAAARVWLYRTGALPQARLAGPVISVGNLSLGGSGKTPLVARVAEMLRDEGLPVAVLSRGYGGSHGGEALIVGDGERVLVGPALAGDEPVMLARGLPGVVVAVGKRRHAVGRQVEARFGPRVHVLDDGFQHVRLARDLDLLCLDARDLEDWPLPAGRLREFPSAAQRADLVLLGGSAATVPGLDAARTFRMGRRLEGFRDPESAPCPPPSRPWVFAGIARPERFRADVESLVPALAGFTPFSDHHAFRPEELARLVRAARAAGADALVTTAKDAVRLERRLDAVGLPLRVLAMTAEIQDEPRFREAVLAVGRRVAFAASVA